MLVINSINVSLAAKEGSNIIIIIGFLLLMQKELRQSEVRLTEIL